MTAFSQIASTNRAGTSLVGAPAQPRPDPIQGGSTEWDRDRLIWGTGVVFVLTAGLTTYLTLSPDAQPVSTYGRVLACLNLWVCAIPLWVFLTTRRRMIPFAPFALALYAVYFTLPVFGSTPMFYMIDLRTRPVWEAVDPSLEFVLMGSVSLVVGLYGTGFLLARIPRLRHEIDLKRALPALSIVSILSLAVRLSTMSTASRTFGSIFTAVSVFGQVTLSGLIIAWLRGHLSIGYKALTLALLGILVAAGLALGLLATVALPVAGFLFTLGWERRRIPWAIVIAGVLVFIPLNAAKAQFRAQVWNTSSGLRFSPANIVDLVGQFVSIAVETAAGENLTSEAVTNHDQARLNGLATLATVVNETPRSVPYWDGYTYSDLLWHFVPRIIVPEKPAPSLGHEFPKRYELIGYFDDDTSINLLQLVECYINFGAAGVIGGMFIIGFIYAALDHVYSSTAAGAMIGCTFFSGLMNMESNFSLVFGLLPFSILFFNLLIRAFPREKSPAVTAAA